MLAPFAVVLLRCFVGLLLLAAAAGKARHYAAFRNSLGELLGTRAGWRAWLAPAIVGAELLVAALALGPAPHIGMPAALLMFGTFTAFIAYKFFTESVVRCSCFGEAARPTSGYDLLRNVLVLLAIAAYLMLAGSAVALAVPALALALGLAVLLCVVAISFHEIVSLLVNY